MPLDPAPGFLLTREAAMKTPIRVNLANPIELQEFPRRVAGQHPSPAWREVRR